LSAGVEVETSDKRGRAGFIWVKGSGEVGEESLKAFSAVGFGQQSGTELNGIDKEVVGSGAYPREAMQLPYKDSIR